MTKKWYAKINANDKLSGKEIKIGIVPITESELFMIVNSADEFDGNEVTTSIEQGIKDIRALWGDWNSFEWIA